MKIKIYSAWIEKVGTGLAYIIDRTTRVGNVKKGGK